MSPSYRPCVNFEKGDFLRIVVLKFKVIYDTKNYNSPLEFIDCLPGEVFNFAKGSLISK